MPIAQPCQVGRGSDSSSQRLVIQEFDIEAEAVHLLNGFAQFGHLMVGYRNVDLTGATKIAVDAVEFDEGLDVLEVALAELKQGWQFVGPAAQSVAETVGQARGNETAVAPCASITDAGAFDEHDVAVRVHVMG